MCKEKIVTQELFCCDREDTGIGDSERLRTELNMRERQLANLIKNIPGGVHQCANDANMTLLSMSDGFLNMFGYSKEDIEIQFESKFINMVYPADRAKMRKSLHTQLAKGADLELEYRVLRKDVPPLWVLDKGRLIDDGSGNACFYCLLIDITDRKCQQEELRLLLERYKVILDQTTDIIFEWDILQDTLVFSSNWRKRFGYEAIDTQISKKIPLSANIHQEDMPYFISLMKDAAAGVPYSETEFRIRNLEGKYSWNRIRATVQYNNDGQPIKAVGVIVDIDDEKKQKHELMMRAQYDLLTGIYNKATINAIVEERMQDGYKHSSNLLEYHALLIVDVDYFKTVNDTYGHLCGDSVLSMVATALKGNVRRDDLVGRIGGDEFLVYLPEITAATAVINKAEQLMQALSCIRPAIGAPPITCSIGVAILPRSYNKYETLYQAADRALYQQKNNGRNGFSIYELSTNETELIPSCTLSAVSHSIISKEDKCVDDTKSSIKILR